MLNMSLGAREIKTGKKLSWNGSVWYAKDITAQGTTRVEQRVDKTAIYSHNFHKLMPRVDINP